MNWNSHEFVWLDWAVLVIGLLGVVWAVWHAIVKDKKASKGESSSDYLFGKGEPWYVIGMAIFAANIGSEHLVGLAGTGAKDGVGMAHWEMQGWMILFLGWLLVFIIAMMIVVSCFTPAPSKEQVEAITFTADYRKMIRSSWNVWDIVGTLLVIGLCGAFYWYFW